MISQNSFLTDSSRNFLLEEKLPRNFTTFICSLNFFLSIVGYSIAMAILSPLAVDIDISSGANVFFTWPYRVFSILVAALALFYARSQPFPKINWKFGLLIIFWLLYFLRAFYDLEVRSSPSPLAWAATPGVEFQAWSYIFPITLLPMLAVLKGFDLIDFNKVLNWILIIGGGGIVCAIFSTQKQVDASWTEEVGRASASAMLNTIALGHLGLTVGICALFKFLYGKVGLFKKIALIGIGLLSVYIMLKAGSRGPLLACFAVFFIWAMAKSRYAIFGAGLAGAFAGGVWLFLDSIVDFISKISPTMSNRLTFTFETGDSSGRDIQFSEVWRECLNNPLTGFQLDFLGYSHNAVLDGFMMFGFIFGWIVLILILVGFFSAYKMIKLKQPNFWVALLLVQFLTACQTSGTFGANATIHCLLVVVFLFNQKRASIFRDANRNFYRIKNEN